jgi:hypothetical protein
VILVHCPQFLLVGEAIDLQSATIEVIDSGSEVGGEHVVDGPDDGLILACVGRALRTDN